MVKLFSNIAKTQFIYYVANTHLVFWQNSAQWKTMFCIVTPDVWWCFRIRAQKSLDRKRSKNTKQEYTAIFIMNDIACRNHTACRRTVVYMMKFDCVSFRIWEMIGRSLQ